ncbi:MAG: tRNA (adenosine(37)-N6)-threonylcarbamoyltransferase complex transferase subunit TsaD [Patescibacteria group bacterium]
MTILGIETSCDDTAVSVVEGRGGLRRPRFRVLAQVVSSQIAVHAPWGGVVPNLAKREHARNLIPVLREALRKVKLVKIAKATPWGSKGVALNTIRKILEREPELLEQFLAFVPTIATPKIDAIAVTVGPGLEPALWTGINLARALALVWKKPIIPVNHLEGHIVSVLADSIIKFPALALIISGGHTELVIMKDWLKYKIIGQTRDDAAGEAFDKVARLLGLPYPGGPEISRLAEAALASRHNWPSRHRRDPKEQAGQVPLMLPRPMINSPDFDFSFSGLKTAVLYLLRKIPRTVLDGVQGQFLKSQMAREFQQAVVDVLIAKTVKAIEKYQPKTLMIAGGVSANQLLRQQFAARLAADYPEIKLLLPAPALSIDNATMIALAGYLRLKQKYPIRKRLRARGRLVLK